MNGKLRIIEAARTIIIRNGIEGATMREIAKESGMSTGAIYHYYKNKEDILYEIMDDSLSETVKINRKLDKNEDSEEIIIGDIYKNIIKRFGKSNENKLQLYLAQEAIQGNDELKAKFKHKYKTWIEDTERLIIKLYNIKNSKNTKVLSSLLIGAIDGMVLQLLLESNTSSVEDISEIYHKLLKTGIPKLLDFLNQ